MPDVARRMLRNLDDSHRKVEASPLHFQNDKSRRATMHSFRSVFGRIAMAGVVSMGGAGPVVAATYVYVSNAEDGDISMYTMQADGSLQPGARVKVAATVMPMVVSHDRKFLFAAS